MRAHFKASVLSTQLSMEPGVLELFERISSMGTRIRAKATTPDFDRSDGYNNDNNMNNDNYDRLLIITEP